MTGVSDQIPEGLTLNTICKFGGELSSCLRTEEWKRFFNSDRVLLKVCWGLEIAVGSARHFLAGLPLLAIPAALVHSSTFDAVLIFSVWPMRPINSATSNPYQMTSWYEVYVLTLNFWTYWKNISRGNFDIIFESPNDFDHRYSLKALYRGQMSHQPIIAL